MKTENAIIFQYLMNLFILSTLLSDRNMSSSDLVQKIKQLEDKAKFEKERADKAVAEVAKLKNENEKLKVDMEVMRLKLENFELK